MKKERFTKALCAELAALCIAGLCGGCVGKEVNIIESLSFDGDLVEISEREGIVKIDSITAGLDTYAFDCTLFDLEKNQTLCTVSFAEGAWISGQTEGGFYAIDTQKKELAIYDTTGTIVAEHSVADIPHPLLFCTLSEDKRQFVYTDTDGTRLTVRDLTTKNERQIPLKAALRDTLSFRDGILRAVGVEGQVYAVNTVENTCRLVVDDRRVTQHFPAFSLGQTETNFLVADDEGYHYVPISFADEIPVGGGESGFATMFFSADRYQVRFYDLKNRRISQHAMGRPAESVCITHDGELLLVVGDPMKKQHTIHRPAPVTAFKELTVLSTDTAAGSQPPTAPSHKAETVPAAMVKGVPLLSQFPTYPTGCESVSAVMALRHSGKKITVDEFIDGHLPMSHEFYIAGGKSHGPSPYEYFIGSPRSAASYGCMAPVLQKAMADCLGDPARVQDVGGTTLEDLSERFIQKGTPVIVWATIRMAETNPTNSWYLSDGSRFTWPRNEHCMVLVGYDEDNYYFNDPYEGAMVAYKKSLCEDRFAEMGRQALVVRGK